MTDDAPLCDHHEAVIHNLAQKDNIDDRDSDRVAAHMIRQCCAPRDRSLR